MPRGSTGLVLCYGIFGFGYILPATYLPSLARSLVDDPRLFGMVWPVFGLAADELAVHDFCAELLAHHGVADATYQRVHGALGEPGVVELTTLVGYFAMVSWVMNVARTPSRPTTGVEPLVGWPA